MNSHVLFDNVSKKYSLGLTRTSLPTILSGWVKRPFKKSTLAHDNNRVLWALRDVSFELGAGESLALVGSNGAGKTTILKLLANITKPTSGTITTNGQLSALIELGAGFHPDLTGRENIFLNGSILGLDKEYIKRRFDEIVAFAELDQFIDTPVKRYSSGMGVRLGFAVAASIDPEILLVDEVLAVGDASFRQKCLARIQTLLKNGTSLVFVSHNLYMVQAVCNRALYISHGEVKQEGDTKAVIEAYEQDLHREQARRLEQSGFSELIESADPRDVEITNVEILGLDGLVNGNLDNMQPAQIRVHYHAYRDLGKVNLAIFIRRADGLTCCMMRTKTESYEFELRQGGGMISVTMSPLQLIGGQYFAEAWFLNESDTMALVTKGGRSDWFSVISAVRSTDDTSGIYQPITHWQLEHDTLSDV